VSIVCAIGTHFYAVRSSGASPTKAIIDGDLLDQLEGWSAEELAALQLTWAHLRERLATRPSEMCVPQLWARRWLETMDGDAVADDLLDALAPPTAPATGPRSTAAVTDVLALLQRIDPFKGGNALR